MGNSHTQFDISAAVLINKQFSHYVIILHIRTHASTRTDKHTYTRIYVYMYVCSFCYLHSSPLCAGTVRTAAKSSRQIRNDRFSRTQNLHLHKPIISHMHYVCTCVLIRMHTYKKAAFI